MLYSLLELNRAALAPFRASAQNSKAFLGSPLNPWRDTAFARSMIAATDFFEFASRRYDKPDWGIDHTELNGELVPVTIDTLRSTPWCRLLRFRKETASLPQPRLLIVAPLSGHYATLLRDTVDAFLPTHDVFVTDWSDARLVEASDGQFDLDDYIDHVRDMLTAVGSGAHVLAVCQPGPAVLAAVSMMAEDEDPALPASMVFMGSPIDARRSPTVPNKLSEQRSLDWFKQNMIHTVPAQWPGKGRRVYPGFVQLTSFLQMNWGRHMDAQLHFFEHLVKNDGDSADKHREFYNEYLAVLDLPEEFYIQTIDRVFQQHLLARGLFHHRDRLVKPEAIHSVGLMTVEGENDDISGIGQTQAAHDVCTHVPDDMKEDYVQPGVGHFGVFNGSRFRENIVPRVTDFISRFSDADIDEEMHHRLPLASVE